MKLLLIACLLLTAKDPVATLHIHLPHHKEVTLALPVKGTNYWMNRQTYKLDNKGNCTIKIPQDNCGLILIDTDKEPIRLITAPGDDIDINIAGTTTFKGSNAAGHQYYNTRSRYSIMDINNPYKKDTSAALIEQTIHHKRDQELSQIDSLHVTPAWASFARLDIRYYYAASLADAMAYKFWFSKNNLKEEYAKEWEQSFKEMPLDDINAVTTENFKYYTELYYRVYRGSYLREKTKTQHLGNVEMINKYFKGEVKGYITAWYLANSLLQKNYEPELVDIYNQYIAEYPDNKYIPFLKDEVNAVIAFQQSSLQEPADAYTFLSPKITSFDSLLQTLKGQAWYVDIWATWCVPCKEEFRYKTPILDEKGYKRLYLSIDSPDRDSAWKDMIKYYKLRGTHLRTDAQLFKDMKTQIKLATIPRYLLIDKNGKIINANAARPSNSNALRRQL